MSAWIVTKRHISFMIDTAMFHRTDEWAVENGVAARSAFRRSLAVELPQFKWRHDGHMRDFETNPPSEVGQMLWSENEKSVAHRYNSETGTGECTYGEHEEFEYTQHIQDTVGYAMKQIDCYEYQSCEHPDWDESEAFAFCQALRKSLCRNVEGYEKAPWGIE